MGASREIVPFVVNGTDSALRKETTYPVISIDLEPAEMFDILDHFQSDRRLLSILKI